MSTELVKIQGYVSQHLANQLSEYKKIHAFKSTSEAIAVALTRFFGHISDPSDEAHSQQGLKNRIEQLENTVISLSDRIEMVERKVQVCTSRSTDAGCDNNQHSFLSASDVNYSLASTAAWSMRKANDTPAASMINRAEVQESALNLDLMQEFKSDLLSESLDEIQIETPLVVFTPKMLQGISASMLIKRLKTSPATLRKYLRELARPGWAVQRDPDQLGWIYDPLLQRYYPVQVNTDGSLRTLELGDISMLNGVKRA